MTNTNKKKDENEHLHEKTPSFFQMAKNFTKSLKDHVANGMVSVPQLVYMERLDACNKCPHLILKTKRCGKCGCMLEHKAKWESATCPDIPSRWENGGPITGSDEENDINVVGTANKRNNDIVDYPRTGGLSPDTGPRN